MRKTFFQKGDKKKIKNWGKRILIMATEVLQKLVIIFLLFKR